MNGAQQIVGLGGMGLIAVNFWTGDQRADIGPLLAGKSAPNSHGAFREIGAELLFVVIATALAGLGGGWGTAMAAVVVGLFILWGIQHYAGGPTTTKSSTTSATPAPTTASAA